MLLGLNINFSLVAIIDAHEVKKCTKYSIFLYRFSQIKYAIISVNSNAIVDYCRDICEKIDLNLITQNFLAFSN